MKIAYPLYEGDGYLHFRDTAAKAPAPVVEGIKRRQGELHALIEKVKTALAKLG